MIREDIEVYIKEQTGEPMELKYINESLYIKFDFLPYDLRSFIHAQPDYDHSSIMFLERDCGCGGAFFINANHFFNLAKRFK